MTDYLRRNASRAPGQLALSTLERDLTWSELLALVQKAKQYLGPLLPTKQQEIVSLLMPNSWQYVVAYLAIVDLGHIVLPVDVIFKPLEIKAIVGQIKPKMLIVDNFNKTRAQNITVPVVEFDQLINHDLKTTPLSLRLPAQEQIASLFFTSGTTGKPKAAPWTHRNHLWNIEACSRVWDWDATDSLLISLRLSHMHGLVMGLSGALYHGNSLYLRDRFDELETLELLASGKISIFTHGPLVYARLLEVPNKQNYDLSKVRLFISGSGPLPPAVWQDFKDTFKAEILEVYGTTETGRIASNLLNERIPGSPGRPLPGVEIKFDEHNQVMVKSAGIFPGYLNNQAATDKIHSTEGFWKTGDIGRLENGRLILVGRLQEKIRKQGYSISPRDIEWALHQYPAIKEALVMGIQKKNDSSDKLVYFLVSNASQTEILDFCRANLPSIWRPDQIVMLKQLPRTHSGKPQIHKLKAMIN